MKKLLLLLLLSASLSSCVPSLSFLAPTPKEPIATNPGRAQELNILAVLGQGDGNTKNQAFSAARSSFSGAYPSWFRLTDEITDPSNAVLLEISIDELLTEQEQRGTKKWGLYWYYTTRASVTLSLIDAQTGAILASFSNSDYASSDEGYPSYSSVVANAIRNSTYGLMRRYTN